MLTNNDLRRVVHKQQEVLSRDQGIPRDSDARLLPGFATIISGIRRCGKSTLAMQLLKDASPVYYANFEDLNFAGFQRDDFLRLDTVFREELGSNGIFFFDEIQNIPEWERYVRQLLDQGEKVIITGSNASMLSRELGTHLTGRHLTYELYPFSYREFLRLQQTGHHIDQFENYIKMGGFPEYLKHCEKQILVNLFHDIFYRDIMLRNELRNESAVKLMLQYIISNIGKETSFNKLKDLIGVGSGNTVQQFVEHFEAAYLFFSLKKFDYSIKKQIVNPKKMYCIDNAIIGTNAFQFSENKGRFLENLVFIELKRRGKEIYYHHKYSECDFILKEGASVTQALQVCFDLNSENMQRETAGLLDAMNEYNLKEGHILTFDLEDRLRIDSSDITIQPVWKWLLE
jgi:uncharacterized protein